MMMVCPELKDAMVGWKAKPLIINRRSGSLKPVSFRGLTVYVIINRNRRTGHTWMMMAKAAMG